MTLSMNFIKRICCSRRLGKKMVPLHPKTVIAAILMEATVLSMTAILTTGIVCRAAVEPVQDVFPSAKAAVSAMTAAMRSAAATPVDAKALQAIFGAEAKPLISSGDPATDLVDQKNFLERYDEKNTLETEGPDKMVLYVGNDRWPFPVPIVRTDGGWRFDTDAGAAEILARRIGRNELSVIQVCLAYVDAQREYARKDHDGDGLLEYARRFASTPGKKNGLYWHAEEAGEESPLGVLVAEAQETGYISGEPGDTGKGAVPYYGYYYRILKAQGKHAPGGAYDYTAGDDHNMIGGFALAAVPARYGSSGIMTFITNHDGIVYQKDIGDDTERTARAMTLFDPDESWEAVKTPEANEIPPPPSDGQTSNTSP